MAECMARKIDTRWYDTYLRAKTEFSRQGSGGTLASVAQALAMNQKTLSRMVTAGRYLERQRPGLERECIRCSYVHMEILEKIARIASPQAEALMPQALSNEVSIADLNRTLNELRGDHPLLAHTLNVRSNKRRTAKALVREVETCLRDEKATFFGARHGRVLKTSNFPAFQAPHFVVQDVSGAAHSLIFCKVGADSRPALAVAMELYELAQARRSMAPNIWMIFPERSEVMNHLVELALWLGGSPFNGSWLYLAHVAENDSKMYLDVLFERECAQVLDDMHQGLGRVDQALLRWHGNDLEAPEKMVQLSNGYEFSLAVASGHRRYRDLLSAGAKALMEQGLATKAEKGQVLEDELGL